MKSLVAIIAYVFEALKFIIVSYHIIGLTPSKRRTRYLMIPLIIILGIITYFNGEFTLAVNIVMVVSLVLIWFHEKAKLSILTIIIEWFTISFIDLMMWLICVSMTPLGNNYSANQNIIDVTSNIIGVLPIILGGFIMRKKNAVLRRKLEQIRIARYTLIILIIMAMCIVSACMQGMVLGDVTFGVRRLIMAASIILSFFVVALCILYINVDDSRKQLSEINILNQECIEYQKNYYTSIVKKDEELRAFKHDINKHLNSLKILFKENKFDEIGEYLDKIGENLETDYIYKTGNLIADYIINGKIKEITEKVRLSVKIIGNFPEDIKLGNIDVCIILANILDNAKEAILQYEGERSLEIEIKNYQKKIYITVKNSSPKREYKHGISTKKDKENHGYGMRNVQRIVDKYDGSIEMKWQDSFFITEIEI